MIQVNKKVAFPFLAALLLLLSLSFGFGQRRERVVDTWKPLHYDVSVSFNDELSQISSARTEISLKVLAQSLSKIDIDFGELPIDSIQVDKAPARFERTPETLN